MPTAYLKKLAKLNNTSIDKLEKFWSQAKEIAKSEGQGKSWGLITTIFQNKLKKEGFKVKAFTSIASISNRVEAYENIGAIKLLKTFSNVKFSSSMYLFGLLVGYASLRTTDIKVSDLKRDSYAVFKDYDVLEEIDKCKTIQDIIRICKREAPKYEKDYIKFLKECTSKYIYRVDDCELEKLNKDNLGVCWTPSKKFAYSFAISFSKPIIVCALFDANNIDWILTTAIRVTNDLNEIRIKNPSKLKIVSVKEVDKNNYVFKKIFDFIKKLGDLYGIDFIGKEQSISYTNKLLFIYTGLDFWDVKRIVMTSGNPLRLFIKEAYKKPKNYKGKIIDDDDDIEASSVLADTDELDDADLGINVDPKEYHKQKLKMKSLNERIIDAYESFIKRKEENLKKKWKKSISYRGGGNDEDDLIDDYKSHWKENFVHKNSLTLFEFYKIMMSNVKTRDYIYNNSKKAELKGLLISKDTYYEDEEDGLSKPDGFYFSHSSEICKSVFNRDIYQKEILNELNSSKSNGDFLRRLSKRYDYYTDVTVDIEDEIRNFKNSHKKVPKELKDKENLNEKLSYAFSEWDKMEWLGEMVAECKDLNTLKNAVTHILKNDFSVESANEVYKRLKSNRIEKTNKVPSVVKNMYNTFIDKMKSKVMYRAVEIDIDWVDDELDKMEDYDYDKAQYLRKSNYAERMGFAKVNLIAVGKSWCWNSNTTSCSGNGGTEYMLIAKNDYSNIDLPMSALCAAEWSFFNNNGNKLSGEEEIRILNESKVNVIDVYTMTGKKKLLMSKRFKNVAGCLNDNVILADTDELDDADLGINVDSKEYHEQKSKMRSLQQRLDAIKKDLNKESDEYLEELESFAKKLDERNRNGEFSEDNLGDKWLHYNGIVSKNILWQAFKDGLELYCFENDANKEESFTKGMNYFTNNTYPRYEKLLNNKKVKLYRGLCFDYDNQYSKNIDKYLKYTLMSRNSWTPSKRIAQYYMRSRGNYDNGILLELECSLEEANLPLSAWIEGRWCNEFNHKEVNLKKSLKVKDIKCIFAGKNIIELGFDMKEFNKVAAFYEPDTLDSTTENKLDYIGHVKECIKQIWARGINQEQTAKEWSNNYGNLISDCFYKNIEPKVCARMCYIKYHKENPYTKHLNKDNDVSFNRLLSEANKYFNHLKELKKNNSIITSSVKSFDKVGSDGTKYSFEKLTSAKDVVELLKGITIIDDYLNENDEYFKRRYGVSKKEATIGEVGWDEDIVIYIKYNNGKEWYSVDTESKLNDLKLSGIKDAILDWNGSVTSYYGKDCRIEKYDEDEDSPWVVKCSKGEIMSKFNKVTSKYNVYLYNGEVVTASNKYELLKEKANTKKLMDKIKEDTWDDIEV